MAVTLNPIEQRVLGVLIEKSLALPAYYPMTLNAVVAACNQKSNRDPVMELAEGEAAAALHQLQQWQLVSQAAPDRGSRANRFCHEVERRFGWNAAQRGLMAELMLRGPQTLGELRARASRMTHLESPEYTHELLKELMVTDPPMVVELPRRPGQSTTRFGALLGGPVIAEPVSTPAAGSPAIAAVETSGGARETAPALDARVRTLEQEVANLQASLAGLRQRLREAGVLQNGG
jgi:uncharacterized protein